MTIGEETASHRSAAYDLWPVRLFAIVLLIVALPLLWGGVELLLLGGSAYYLMTGLAVATSAILLWRGRVAGARLYWLMLLGTLGWALWDAGLNGWTLASRVLGPAVLGLVLLLPAVSRRLRPASAGMWAILEHRWRLRSALAVIAVVTAAGIGLSVLHPHPAEPILQAGTGPATLQPVSRVGVSAPDGDWPTWGNDPGGSRFSPLAQITPTNAGRLHIAWVYRYGLAPEGLRGSLEVTPIKVGDSLYFCTPANDIIALDAETGRQRWRFHAGVDMGSTPYGTCRGVAYFRAAGSADCPERIFTNTVDMRLLAVDARTGTPCRSFGTNGAVSLRDGLGPFIKGYDSLSSAPTIAHGNVVLGGFISDGQYWGEPSGVIRAFDAVTGKLAWAFDVGHPERSGAPPPGGTYTHATPNSWAPMSTDEALGLVYVPTGNATPDYYGAQRRPFDDRYSSAVVALDAATGRPRWLFQTVHHDLWDYDVPAQPTLLDMRIGGMLRHVLIQPTKRGDLFILDRETGKPLFPVVERPVPQAGAASGERLSFTQPFSVALPAFRGGRLEERDMWGITPLDTLWCRITFRRARYDGIFTPPGLAPSIAYPAYGGGINWGGVSIDVDRGLLIANSNRIANYLQLLPRPVANRLHLFPRGAGGISEGDVGGAVPQSRTPFAARVHPFFSPLGIPCQAPPYGQFTAMDLSTGKVVWTRGVGSARDNGPLGYATHLPIPMALTSFGGTLATASGVTFLGGSQDRAFRAFDTLTGRLLYEKRLPAGGQATPMSYRGPRSGRQFVVQAAGGSAGLQTRTGDYIIAFAIDGVPAPAP